MLRWTARSAVRRLSTQKARPQHDIGGQYSLLNAPIPADEPLHSWELEAHALYASLAKAGCFTTDEARRTIEAFDSVAYSSWGYYEKFSACNAILLRENGFIQPGELETEIFGEVQQQSFDSYEPGELVRVKHESSHVTTWRRPHLRTPGYLFGATGIVERHMGSFADPSLLAYGVQGAPTLPLYRVRFTLGDLWSGAEPEEADSTITVDLYSNWLQRSEDAAVEEAEEEVGTVVIHPPGHHHHHHHHDHHDHDHGHSHGTRQQIERAACEAEGPPSSPGSAVHEALRRLSIRKGLVDADSLRKTMEGLETAGKQLHGASLIVQAWLDDGYKQRLLDDGNSAASELGLTASNPNAPTKVVVVENTDHTHNLVVCTLCSCYPAALLGPAPLWYKSAAYRARAVRRPRKLLSEAFGLNLPQDVKVAVHDATADLRFLVLPQRPEGTDGWSEERLRALVTRDAMVGTAICRSE